SLGPLDLRVTHLVWPLQDTLFDHVSQVGCFLRLVKFLPRGRHPSHVGADVPADLDRDPLHCFSRNTSAAVSTSTFVLASRACCSSVKRTSHRVLYRR